MTSQEQMDTFNQMLHQNMKTQLARARHRGDALLCVDEITNSFLKIVQTTMLTSCFLSPLRDG